MSPQGAFVELTGDRQAESRTEKSYSSCTLPGVINAFIPWEPKKYPAPAARFQIIHAHAAGIDVGSRTHLVAIDQNKDNVREFGVYTKDHQQLIDHFHRHQITTVAMESTGSYWQTLFNALQQAGSSRAADEVLLVNGNQTKNVKAGRPMPT